MAGKSRAAILFRSISASSRVADLGIKGALVYTWLLAHCDDQGRLAGNAKRVKALVVPLLDEITEEDVERALWVMHRECLVVLYSDPDIGRDLIQVVDWWEHNSGLRIIRASKHLPPPGWEDRPTTLRDEGGRFRRGK